MQEVMTEALILEPGNSQQGKYEGEKLRQRESPYIYLCKSLDQLETVGQAYRDVSGWEWASV
jgi:hypothetical protein